jgi:mutator protein MutT
MERTCLSKPLGLSVKAFVRDDAGHILLLRRSTESIVFPGQWDLPGGKCDPGESFWEALVREVDEETGLAIQFAGLAGCSQFEIPEWNVICLVLEVTTDGGDVRLSEEHVAFRWVRQDEIDGWDVCPPLRGFIAAQPMG